MRTSHEGDTSNLHQYNQLYLIVASRRNLQSVSSRYLEDNLSHWRIDGAALRIIKAAATASTAT